jgi:serine/threonine protein kinase
MSNLVGQQIKHYRIDALLGEGGMGAVYHAYNLNLARPVALKMMHRQFAVQPQFQQRFMQEAQAVARLSHPSIVIIHDFDSVNGEYFIVMELVAGISLGAYIRELAERRQVIKLSETAHIVAQVADALDYAHLEGIVHRDIKPDNILIKPLSRPDRLQEPPLRALVTDFGLAKLLEGGIETATGTFMGTMPYMSPEQALAKPIDGRSDLYSLGVVHYQLATGQLPFDIQSPTDAVMKHLHETPREPRQLQPGLPEALAQVIVKSLEKQPENRFQTGREMAESLRQAAAQLTDKDVTSFITASDRAVVSMVTRLAMPDTDSTPEPISPQFETGSRIVVARKGMTSLTYKLDKPTVVIGRTADNDIVLMDDKVSRHHAQLTFTETGWQLTDLNSTNGTFLNNSKLLPNVAQTWHIDVNLRIGDFWLRLEKEAVSTDDRPVMKHSDGTVVAIEEIRSSPGTGVGIHLLTQKMTMAPGGTAVFPLIILNQGNLVDHLTTTVIGLPTSWLSDEIPATHLMPGEQQEVTVTIRPPHSPQSKAGIHPFQIRVTSQATPGDFAEIQGELNLTPFYDFQLECRPQKLTSSNEGEFTINVMNQGNADMTVQMTAVDPEEACVFTFHPTQLTVPSSDTATAKMTISSKTQPAANKSYPFTVSARSIEPGNLQRQCQGIWEQLPVADTAPAPPPAIEMTPPPAKPTTLPEPVPQKAETPRPPVRPIDLPESIVSKEAKPHRMAGCAVLILGLIITAGVGWGIGAASYDMLPRDIADGGSLALAILVWLGGLIFTIRRARKTWNRA